MLRQYLEKEFFVDEKKNGEGKGGRHLEQENNWLAVEKEDNI